MTAFALTSSSQVRLVESLPDGSHVVEIGGVEFRALGAAKMRELQKQKADLEASQKISAELEAQIKEALLERDLAQTREALEKQKAESLKADFARAKEDSARWHRLFISERELRQEASQFIAHGNKTKFDKFLALFDSKAMQFAIKGAIPIWQTWRCQ